MQRRKEINASYSYSLRLSVKSFSSWCNLILQWYVRVLPGFNLPCLDIIFVPVMKKALTSIIIIVYLAFSCGVVINFYYCMGHLNSVKLFGTKSELCGTCGMQMGKSHKCCGDEQKLIKLQDDQQKSYIAYSLQAPDAVINIPSEFIITSVYNYNEFLHQEDHSPPLLTEQDTYLQNGVFRI